MGDYRSKILGKLPKIHDLPGLPTVFVEIDRVIQSPNSGAAELAKVIETDPPTVASLLKMANSSYYWGRQESIPSVRDAVVRLGLQEVRRLCQFACLSRLFVQPSTLVNHSQFWRHSYAVGSVARRIAEGHAASLKQEPDIAFTAGLLHDIGSLILDQFFGSPALLVIFWMLAWKRAWRDRNEVGTVLPVCPRDREAAVSAEIGHGCRAIVEFVATGVWCTGPWVLRRSR